MKIEPLEWDTQFFGKKTGAITIGDNEVAADFITSEAQRQGYELVYFFSKTLQSVLKKSGFEWVDTKVTFSKDVQATEAPIELLAYSSKATPELVRLALQSGWKSRFNEDKKLQPKYEELYTQWLKRSLDGEFDDVVFIYKVGDSIAGLVTIRIENDTNGKVGLFAVAESFRGQGIGKKMLQALEAWYYEKGVKTSEIATQKKNEAACKLYESMGYKISDTSYVYHLHL